MNSSSSSMQVSNLKKWLESMGTMKLQHIERIEIIEKRKNDLGASYRVTTVYRLKEKKK